jgi:hypothetical protein
MCCNILLTVVGLESSDIRRPLDTAQRQAIKVNYPQLVTLLDSDYGLTGELMSADCITMQQMKHIQAGRTDRERNKALLDILSRRSVADFNKFIVCLRNTQPHLAKLLTDGGGNYFILFIYLFVKSTYR